MDTRSFLITKISDQKDGLGKSYSFYRTLEVTDFGIPVQEELQNFVELEDDKNVAFFIGKESISIISFRNEHKYVKNTLREYKKNWIEGGVEKILVSTYSKNFMYLKSLIPEIEEIRMKSSDVKSR